MRTITQWFKDYQKQKFSKWLLANQSILTLNISCIVSDEITGERTEYPVRSTSLQHIDDTYCLTIIVPRGKFYANLSEEEKIIFKLKGAALYAADLEESKQSKERE